MKTQALARLKTVAVNTGERLLPEEVAAMKTVTEYLGFPWKGYSLLLVMNEVKAGSKGSSRKFATPEECLEAMKACQKALLSKKFVAETVRPNYALYTLGRVNVYLKPYRNVLTCGVNLRHAKLQGRS